MSVRRVVVRRSPIHGRGLFARSAIASGEWIIEYGGSLVRWKDAAARERRLNHSAGHTFLFDVGGGFVIDGGQAGNSARWINHSCEPNVEAIVNGKVVVITAIRDIAPDEELLMDYNLQIEAPPDPDELPLYACACGARSCRATMLGATG